MIGLLLALVVLGSFVILGTLTLDSRFTGGGKTIQHELRQQDVLLTGLRDRLSKSKIDLARAESFNRIAEDVSKRREKLQEQEEIISKSLAVKTGLLEEISAIEQEFEAYKVKYRQHVRSGAKGKTFDEFVTLKEEKLKGVTVRHVNAIGMSVLYSDGIKRIPYEELPLDMQDYYQFDPEEKKAAIEAEALAQKAYDRSVNEADQAARKLAEERKQEQLAKDAVVREKHIAALRDSIRSMDDQIDELESQIKREENKRISRAPILRDEISKLQHKKADLSASVQN